MTILHALSAIVSEQSNATKRTMKRVNQLLDYMYYNSNAVIILYASDMILNVHSDASYVSAIKGRSHTGGYFFLGNMPQANVQTQLNGNVHITCAILKLVASSVAKVELGAQCVNTKLTNILQLTLFELGHSHQSTPIHVDNTTAIEIVNHTIKKMNSRAMEINYLWFLSQDTHTCTRL